MADEWRIFQEKDGSWHWKKLNVSTRKELAGSKGGFKTPKSCLEDAAKNGMPK